MKQKILLTIVACALPLAFNARAEQGGMGHYLSGEYVDFSGMPPTQSGWVFGNYYLNYNNGTFNAGKGLPFGGVVALNVTANLQADVPLAIYSFPFDFFGGTLSSGIAIPYVWATVKASGTIDRNGVLHSVTKEQSVSGFGDIQWMPLMAGWTNGDFKFGGLFNIWVPSGDYNTGQLANRGLGYWTFEPMLAFSWISSKIGTEFSVFTAVDFNTDNGTADYQSGDLFHVDATLAQHVPLWGGIAGAGASAFYLKQITGDSGSGAKLGGFEAKTYGVGPTLSYVHPIGKSTLIVDGSWLPQTYAANTTKGNYWWVKLAITF
jgi:hypothetical protein